MRSRRTKQRMTFGAGRTRGQLRFWLTVVSVCVFAVHIVPCRAEDVLKRTGEESSHLAWIDVSHELLQSVVAQQVKTRLETTRVCAEQPIGSFLLRGEAKIRPQDLIITPVSAESAARFSFEVIGDTRFDGRLIRKRGFTGLVSTADIQIRSAVDFDGHQIRFGTPSIEMDRLSIRPTSNGPVLRDLLQRRRSYAQFASTTRQVATERTTQLFGELNDTLNQLPTLLNVRAKTSNKRMKLEITHSSQTDSRHEFPTSWATNDLAVSFHESVVNRWFAPYLAGLAFKEPLKNQAGMKIGRLELANPSPFTIRCTKNHCIVAIHARWLREGHTAGTEESGADEIHIDLDYRLSANVEGWMASLHRISANRAGIELSHQLDPMQLQKLTGAALKELPLTDTDRLFCDVTRAKKFFDENAEKSTQWDDLQQTLDTWLRGLQLVKTLQISCLETKDGWLGSRFDYGAEAN